MCLYFLYGSGFIKNKHARMNHDKQSGKKNEKSKSANKIPILRL